MVSISIFSNFCSWWPLWWILPFLLGLLLGKSIWGKYKSGMRDLEDEVVRQKTQNHNLSSALKQCKEKKDEANIIVSNQAQELTEVNKKLRLMSTQESLALISTPATKSLSEKEAKTAVPKSSKGDYSKLHRTNLQIIEGIGSKLETVLKQNGIENWSDLSSKSYGELRALLDKYGGRYAIVDPKSWPKQATLAKKEKWEKLMMFQANNGSDSKLKKILLKLDIL